MKINSDEIVRLLKLSKLSSYKIAQETGISDQTIQNYKDGKTKPGGANLTILSKYLDKTKDEYQLTETSNIISDPKVTLYTCPECVNKQKDIDYWRSKFYALCEESREVERKYRELLESKIEPKKEIPSASDKKVG